MCFGNRPVRPVSSLGDEYLRRSCSCKIQKFRCWPSPSDLLVARLCAAWFNLFHFHSRCEPHTWPLSPRLSPAWALCNDSASSPPWSRGLWRQRHPRKVHTRAFSRVSLSRSTFCVSPPVTGSQEAASTVFASYTGFCRPVSDSPNRAAPAQPRGA